MRYVFLRGTHTHHNPIRMVYRRLYAIVYYKKYPWYHPVMLALLFAVVFSSFGATTPDCEKWFFESLKINQGAKDCIDKCLIGLTGMDSFMCPTQCQDLCKISLARYIIDELTYKYSLSEAEKKLIAKYPKEALAVYLAKKEAEEAVKRLFGDRSHNNEADAFRHFVWAGLITDKIGKEKAELFLDAHEQKPDQPASEKEMDSYNNAQGISEARRLENEKRFSIENLEKGAIEGLKNGKLKVINPTGKIPEWR